MLSAAVSRWYGWAEEQQKYLDLAGRNWSGETYWLLMPLKMRDPGVILKYDGEVLLDGVPYDKLHLNFESVGQTPGDQFWAYINRKTHLMDRWEFLLDSGFKAVHEWTDYRRFGGLLLSTRRQGPYEIEMQDILVTDRLPDAIFTSPDPLTLNK